MTHKKRKYLINANNQKTLKLFKLGAQSIDLIT